MAICVRKKVFGRIGRYNLASLFSEQIENGRTIFSVQIGVENAIKHLEKTLELRFFSKIWPQKKNF